MSDDRPTLSKQELYWLSRHPLREITERCPHSHRYIDAKHCSQCLAIEVIRARTGDIHEDELAALPSVRIAAGKTLKSLQTMKDES